MNEPDLSFIKSDIDLSEVAPLNRRRVVAFVNCYLYKMIDFLNAFANRAERAILEAERHLRDADIKLQLLEAKLASIPDPSPDSVEILPEERRVDAAEAAAVQNEPKRDSRPVLEETSALEEVSASAVPVEAAFVPQCEPSAPAGVSTSNVLLVKDDPAYAKYFKMLKLGVVEPAIKLKMQSEGVDPSILDNPNAPSPNVSMTTKLVETTEDTSGTSSASSFSDSD